MKLLAIDTSAHVCGVCVYDSGVNKVLSEESRNIGRGHAEILMGLIEACLSKADVSYTNLSRICVTIGPGSFTGVRVGMATARGFGLSLGIPVIGISTLDACEAMARETGYDGLLVTVLDARREEIYVQVSGQMPFVSSCSAFAEAFPPGDFSLCGSGAEKINVVLKKPLPIIHTEAVTPIKTIAHIGAQRVELSKPPEPLYLRSADAKPQAGFTLERI